MCTVHVYIYICVYIECMGVCVCALCVCMCIRMYLSMYIHQRMYFPLQSETEVDRVGGPVPQNERASAKQCPTCLSLACRVSPIAPPLVGERRVQSIDPASILWPLDTRTESG
jgi:hypothetical protein